MPTTDRITINLGTREGELDSETVDELVEASDCSSRSELIRRLLDGDPLDELIE